MKLADALDGLDEWGEDAVLFAKKPWTLESEAEVGVLSENLTIPKEISDRGFEYFLECQVAREVMEVFGGREPTAAERRSLLLYYAENDAYPEWIYPL